MTFTPKGGAEAQTLAMFRDTFIASLVTAATKENGFGIVDVRWGAAAAGGK